MEQQRAPNEHLPPRYLVYPLSVCQASFGPASASACAFTSVMFLEYLLGSPIRTAQGTPRRLAKWVSLACFLYETKWSKIEHKQQSKNAFDPQNKHTTAETAASLIGSASKSLLKVCDHICVFRQRSDATTDKAFTDQMVFITLEQALAKLALLSLSFPVAATITANRSMHTIGVRRKQDEDAQAIAEHLKVVLDPGGDAANFESTPLDEFDQAASFFEIEFVDSHRNDPKTGLSSSAGAGVWIRFDTMAALCHYLLKRYPDIESAPTATSLQKGMRNCFDMQVWHMPGNELPINELAEVALSDEYKAWMRRGDNAVSSGAMNKKRSIEAIV